MKTIAKSLSIVLSALGFSLSPLDAKSVNLTGYAGNFKGTASLSVSGTTGTGPAHVKVVVPKSGDYALFRISGSVTASGTTLPLNGTLVFLSPKTFAVQDIVFGIIPAAGATGSFTSNARALKYTAPFTVSGTTGTFAGSVRTKTTGQKQKLTITSLISTISGGLIYSFTFTVSRRLH